jgi:hypothetical protein
MLRSSLSILDMARTAGTTYSCFFFAAFRACVRKKTRTGREKRAPALSRIVKGGAAADVLRST